MIDIFRYKTKKVLKEINKSKSKRVKNEVPISQMLRKVNMEFFDQSKTMEIIPKKE